jgi:hypothetical protein
VSRIAPNRAYFISQQERGDYHEVIACRNGFARRTRVARDRATVGRSGVDRTVGVQVRVHDRDRQFGWQRDGDSRGHPVLPLRGRVIYRF